MENIAWIIIILGLVILFIRGIRQWRNRDLYANHRATISSSQDPTINTKSTGQSALSKHMPELISLIVLISALFVILSSNYAEGEQKWAFGVIGTIIGYWLKPDK